MMPRVYERGLALGLAAAVQICVLCAPAAASEYRVVYDYGDNPASYGGGAIGLTAKLGVLYGTVQYGGVSKTCAAFGGGCGKLFRLTPDGTGTTVFAFPGKKNAFPDSPVLDLLGDFYGVTQGSTGLTSQIYVVTPGGAEKVIHRFTTQMPNYFYAIAPNLTAAENGKIVGELTNGGDPCGGHNTYGCGMIFEMTKSGIVKILHRFIGGKAGRFPYGGLVSLGGNFYGTTQEGGTNGKGVFFRITPSGEYKVLHSFGQPGGAESIYAALVSLNGKFYGTSYYGGANSSSSNPSGYGCVFSLDESGNETVLYSFQDGADSAGPYTSLVYHGGLFYGMTNKSLFSITPSGTLTTLHTFNRTDGSNLVAMGGSLYGAVNQSGDSGDGIVFEYTP